MSKSKEYSIQMTVCVDDNPVELDDFMDMFIDWVEDHKWYAGGGIAPAEEERGCYICNDTSNSRYYDNKQYAYCPHCGDKRKIKMQESKDIEQIVEKIRQHINIAFDQANGKDKTALVFYDHDAEIILHAIAKYNDQAKVMEEIE